MFEKPRLEMFSYFLAPSIDNSQAQRHGQAKPRSWIICSIFLRGISRHLLFAMETPPRSLSLSLSVLLSPSPRLRYGLPVEWPHKDVRGMYVDYYGRARAFIARPGGAHTIAILLAAIKY